MLFFIVPFLAAFARRVARNDNNSIILLFAQFICRQKKNATQGPLKPKPILNRNREGSMANNQAQTTIQKYNRIQREMRATEIRPAIRCAFTIRSTASVQPNKSWPMNKISASAMQL